MCVQASEFKTEAFDPISETQNWEKGSQNNKMGLKVVEVWFLSKGVPGSVKHTLSEHKNNIFPQAFKVLLNWVGQHINKQKNDFNSIQLFTFNYTNKNNCYKLYKKR